ncbi:class I SAM-dependent DNA methyltransferase [uncultured Prevotella sp.]|uniref:type I restriction-modification system subunit M n=1 Tax=uncultured Prevotella sp. TaxID=159272 RepID=UPI0027E2E538|nr:class I SAM-dependent DNA methyltransferase [uncultured Prevotella sp.]
METKQYNNLFSFIWNIANDVLVHAFEKGDYKKIILPFMVLRRIDVLLESTKKQVLEKKEFCDKNKLTDYTPFLTPITGYPFYNTSAFTMSTLKNEIDPQRLKMNIIEYFNGFSLDVQDIIDKFKLRQQVDNLTEVGRLGSLLEKFTDGTINLSINPVMEEQTDEDGNKQMVERLPGLDNHTMGTIFEELLRKFNEENNVTEAGEHFTPRDYVRLLADLAVVPVKDKLTDNTYTIYDGACGTGGILTIAQEEMERVALEQGKNVKVSIFGQELQADTYATCKADLMISGNINKFAYKLDSVEHQYIAFGSTISQDGHAGEKYDFCISNPPFGTPWKEDLKNWGLDDKREVIDPRFSAPDMSFIPDIGDCQMLFLANNISRMKETELGTRIVEVHNGSSLFTGNAGGGESNLRRYIIENDLLEAIVAMPEKDFYNTGIATYIWVITNRKEERRRGYVQLIDASKICSPLRKNLGEKNCETTEDDRNRILQLLMDFKETPESKIFRNEEFGYWQMPVLRPKRDKEGNIVLKKGKVVMAKNRNEVEQIPLLYPGGIDAFYENEVKPYDAEAEFGEPVIGYELSFTKYFYKPVQLRSLSEIMADLNVLESETKGLWEEIMKQRVIADAVTRGVNPNVKFKTTNIPWLPEIPEHWEMSKVSSHFRQRNVKVSTTESTYKKCLREE